MDRIIMKNMGFFGYHGVLPEEKTLGQKFFVDASLYLPLKNAGGTDDLNDSVNYKEVYDIIKGIVTNQKFDLLESLAERICSEIFAAYPEIQKLRVKVKKPEAPVPGLFDYFGVEIEREREI
ncbi:MAG: dihydroneopterin aldolase [Eubacteriales bacterium]|nr:dihydroneopterin aldolase [Eubacteriales bacterium]MDD3200033.1 dihydroneopterin aldolase [Eubacteriales bacterium]MDD4122182.1 dihydroneopterin aldolase [Eubacteriales bacterium]MDD4630016.1 dihydroneopterin aldolase [Eubacteriales bacterium]